MPRFWEVREDPEYYDEVDEGDWLDDNDVAEKPQKEEFGPYETINS